MTWAISETWRKIMILVSGVALIAGFHYFTLPNLQYHHAAFRALFYFPLVLGAYWFALRGAIGVCILVAVSYLPYVFLQWQGFSVQDFSRLLEGVIFNGLGVLLGLLFERERKHFQELIKVEKLASIGQTVAELAHDLKVPLMTIGGFTNQILKKLDPENPSRRKMEIVIRETARMESMVKEMLDFGRPLELDLKETDLNQLVMEVTAMLEPQSRAKEIVLHAVLEPSIPGLWLDEVKIKQALVNLLLNAIQASPKNGDAWARTKKNGNGVVFEVEDRGCGIQAEKSKDVFKPFFTTKKEGTGLGLPIVKKFIEAHQGQISWHPNPEGGVTFRVDFRRSPGRVS